MSLAGRPSSVPEVPGTPQHQRRVYEVFKAACECGGKRGTQWTGKVVEVVCVECGQVALRIRPVSRVQKDFMASRVPERLTVASESSPPHAV